MTENPMPAQAPSIQINTGDDILRGRYANSLLVSHSPEEFVLDWLLNAPSGAHLVSRIILNPGHVKRIVEVLSANLDQYERQFGEIKSPAPPEEGRFH